MKITKAKVINPAVKAPCWKSCVLTQLSEVMCQEACIQSFFSTKVKATMSTIQHLLEMGMMPFFRVGSELVHLFLAQGDWKLGDFIVKL